MDIYKRLLEMGLEIPEMPKPVASYEPAQICGNLIFASGQTGTVNNKLKYWGKLGKDLTIEEGRDSARLAILNCLSEIQFVAGDLNRIEQIIKVTGYVASHEGFCEQPAVVEGASRLLIDVFGDRGRHA
ncbi:MAG: RidA family protein, partial [Ruminiclostridium sp.]|nr:RidA family protein [Ruminiclostridium sp.]